MKKLTTILFLFIVKFSFATNYYVSSNGTTSDSNSGTDTTHTWTSITKVNSFQASLNSGDSVLFRRGDMFFGNIIVNKAGVVYSAYGSNVNQPIITGFTTITGWTNEGGGVYSKVLSGDVPTNMVTMNGVQQAIGRYPDGNGFFYPYTVKKDSTSSANAGDTIQVYITGLGSSTNWTGADLVMRKNDFDMEVLRIIKHVGDTLWLRNKISGPNIQITASGYGCWIQRDVRTLTALGDWFHDPATNKFSMYFGGVAPTTKIIQVATEHTLFSDTAISNITIDNLNFIGASDTALGFKGTTNNIAIKNCTISYSGGKGIFLNGGATSLIYNNTISYTNGTGIFSNGSISNILNNNVSAVGTLMGQIDASFYDGVYFQGGNDTIRYNYVHNIAYNNFAGKRTGNWLLQYNVGDSACTGLDDGGGIYTSGWTSGTTGTRIIDHNIFTNAIGNDAGTSRTYSFTAGVYLDEVAQYVTVTNNTTANNSYTGLKAHKSPNNIFRNNLSYNNTYAQYVFADDGANMTNVVFKNNTLVSKTSTQYAMYFNENGKDSLLTFYIGDSNVIARPIADGNTVYYHYPVSPYDYFVTLSGWKSYVGKDAASTASPKTIASASELNLLTNPTASTSNNFFSTFKRMDARGGNHNDSVAILPYESTLLFDNGSSPSVSVSIGGGITVTLPTNSANLVGSASGGSGFTYQWTQTSGPNTATFLTPTAQNTTVSNLITGSYTFKLTATNSGLVSGNSSVTALVLPSVIVILIPLFNIHPF